MRGLVWKIVWAILILATIFIIWNRATATPVTITCRWAKHGQTMTTPQRLYYGCHHSDTMVNTGFYLDTTPAMLFRLKLMTAVPSQALSPENIPASWTFSMINQSCDWWRLWPEYNAKPPTCDP